LSATPAGQPVLEAVKLEKSFGSVHACAGISFTLARGEVLALVGENGAGKTTLLNLLMGFYQPDGGELRVHGTPQHLRNPRDAEAAGLGMVHQHFTLVNPLTVAENVVLGREPSRLGLFDRRRAEREVAEAAKLHGLPIDPHATVAQLSVGGRQRVEILKVLWRGAQILAFDEPTGALSPSEAEALCRTIRELAAQGRSILFVSHKLREVQAVADRIAVLRAGELVGTLPAAGANLDEVAAMMIGGPVEAPAEFAERGTSFDTLAPQATQDERNQLKPFAVRSPLRGRIEGHVLLALAAIQCSDDRGAPVLRGLSLSVSAGEIVGVAGVDGNGQRELAEVCTGLRRSSSGRLEIAGRDATALTVAQRRLLGIAYVPEDRERGGLCGTLTVAENLALGRAWTPPFRKGRLWPRLDRVATLARGRELVERFDIRPPDPAARAANLSGGNQQKVILARELDGAPRLVIAVNPTRGLDLHATTAVHSQLREAARRGAAVLVISFDLDELRELAERIVVLYGGRVVGETPVANATDAILSKWMAGAAT
jgi:simple sugar transport system ATP-binding protein